MIQEPFVGAVGLRYFDTRLEAVVNGPRVERVGDDIVLSHPDYEGRVVLPVSAAPLLVEHITALAGAKVLA